MNITAEDMIVWLMVGAAAGFLTGALVKRSKEGFGHWTNLGIGLVGAVLGGCIFELFGLAKGLDAIAISLKDLVAALVGSLIFLAGVWFVKRSRRAV